MTSYELIDLLFVACSALLIWAVVETLSLFSERKENKAILKSREYLIEKLTKSNHYLQQQLERVKDENEALRTQNHQLRNERNEQKL